MVRKAGTKSLAGQYLEQAASPEEKAAYQEWIKRNKKRVSKGAPEPPPSSTPPPSGQGTTPPPSGSGQEGPLPPKGSGGPQGTGAAPQDDFNAEETALALANLAALPTNMYLDAKGCARVTDTEVSSYGKQIVGFVRKYRRFLFEEMQFILATAAMALVVINKPVVNQEKNAQWKEARKPKKEERPHGEKQDN